MTQGRSISILVHAASKMGKTTLGSTAPKPMLLLDAEAAYRFLPGTKVFWDPTTQAPPVADGSWEICVVAIRSYTHMIRAYEWLNSGQHPFVSVVIDSITEVQVKCKDDISADGEMKIQQWGKLLDHMERLIRGFRDLTEHPTKPLQAVVITSMTEFKDYKWRPYVQGKLQVKMPYFLDLIMYLYTEEVQPDPSQPPVRVHRGLTVSTREVEAGERVQGRLPAVIDNPRVDTILDTVFGPLPAPQQAAPVAASTEGEPTA